MPGLLAGLTPGCSAPVRRSGAEAATFAWSAPAPKETPAYTKAPAYTGYHSRSPHST